MNSLRRIGALTLFVIGAGAVCFGSVPEIDAASGANAIALLAGALLIVRGRRR